MPQAIGIGVIGLGTIGQIHLATVCSLVDRFRLAAVADLDDALGRRTGKEAGVPAYASGAELLDAPALQAVVIATPAESHGELIERAAAAGKHIFCEKPLDVTLMRIDRALAAVKQAGVLLMVGFNRRFDRDFEYLSEELDVQRVGNLISIHIISRDPILRGPPRRIEGMSGLFFETTVHDLDMLRFLTGAEIEWVHVQASGPVHGQAEVDTALTFARMTNGVAATIDNSQAAYHYDQRIEVFGTKGAMIVGNETTSTSTLLDSQGIHAPTHQYFFPQRYRQSYENELHAFCGFINAQVEPRPSGNDGRAATVAALACQRAMDEGRPVLLSEIG